MDGRFIAAQVFGLIGVVFFLMSYFPRSNRALYVMQAVGCASFGIQFIFLDAIGGCMSQVFIVVRNLMLTQYNHRSWVRWKGWVPVFIAFAVAITVFTWDGVESAIPLINMCVGTVAMWTNNAGTIRIAAASILSPLWIVYDIMTGAYLAITTEIVVISSVLISIYRYGWKELRDPDSEFQKK